MWNVYFKEIACIPSIRMSPFPSFFFVASPPFGFCSDSVAPTVGSGQCPSDLGGGRESSGFPRKALIFTLYLNISQLLTFRVFVGGLLATARHPFTWHCLVRTGGVGASELRFDLKLVLVVSRAGRGGGGCVHWRCVALPRPHCHELKAICDV